MTIEDILNFKLSINDNKAFDLPRTGISLSLKDSLYSLSPEIIITASDPYGLLLGTRVGGYGVKFTFSFTANGKDVSYPMRADHFEVTSLEEGTTSISGSVDYHLKHAFIYQPSEVRAFKGQTPDQVVSTLIKEFGSQNFKSSNIDKTSILDMTAIYNPGWTPSKFIEDIILPLSTRGTDSINTPMYVFIDAKNQFNMKSLKSLFEKKYVKTLLLSDHNDIRNFNSEKERTARAFSVYPFSQEYVKIFDSVDLEAGRLDTEGKFSKLSGGFKNISSSYLLGFYDREKSTTRIMAEDEMQSEDAQLRTFSLENKKNRKGYLIDKLVLATSLDLDLCAGAKVKLKTFYGNSSESMIAYNNEYIIESSVHNWNSSVNTGITQLVLGTPNTYITNTVMAKKAYEG